MDVAVPYLLPIPAGWFITFVAIITIIGLLIGLLKVQNKILTHLKGPKLIWNKHVVCKHCEYINELDSEEQCSESFTCVVCKKENVKD